MNEILTATLLLLAFLGIVDSGYIAWKHSRKEPLACPVGENSCNIVTKSKWSEIFGIRNEVLGIIYYLVIGILGLTILFNQSYQSLAINILLFCSSIGLLFSLFFVYVQAGIIKKYCFYCLISAILSVLIFLNVLGLVS